MYGLFGCAGCVSLSVWSDGETKPNMTLERENYSGRQHWLWVGTGWVPVSFYKSNCQVLAGSTVSIKTTKTEQIFSPQLSFQCSAVGSTFSFFLWGLTTPPLSPLPLPTNWNVTERVRVAAGCLLWETLPVKLTVIIVPTFVIVWLALVNISSITTSTSTGRGWQHWDCWFIVWWTWCSQFYNLSFAEKVGGGRGKMIKLATREWLVRSGTPIRHGGLLLASSVHIIKCKIYWHSDTPHSSLIVHLLLH